MKRLFFPDGGGCVPDPPLSCSFVLGILYSVLGCLQCILPLSPPPPKKFWLQGPAWPEPSASELDGVKAACRALPSGRLCRSQRVASQKLGGPDGGRVPGPLLTPSGKAVKRSPKAAPWPGGACWLSGPGQSWGRLGDPEGGRHWEARKPSCIHTKGPLPPKKKVTTGLPRRLPGRQTPSHSSKGKHSPPAFIN